MASKLNALGVETSETMLPAGDFAFCGNGPEGPVTLGFERKTLGDYLASLTGGRIAEQAPKLSTDYDLAFIILESSHRGTEDGHIVVPRRDRDNRFTPKRIPESMVINSLFILHAAAGITTLRTMDEDETARTLASVYKLLSKPWDSHSTFKRIKPVAEITRVQFQEPPLLQVIASCYPGIGWDRARSISGRFASVREFVMATERDLRQIDGIGKRTAAAVAKINS